MAPWSRLRQKAVVAAVAVFCIVVFAGTRLIYLGADARARKTRETAQAAAISKSDSLERVLRELDERTRGTSAGAAGVPATVGAARNSVPPAADDESALLISPVGQLLAGGEADRGAAQAIAVALNEARRRAGGALAPGVLGALRVGGDWFVAALGPVPAGHVGSAAGSAQVVVVRRLVRLLAQARVGDLVSQGYDIQVADRDPVSGRWRGFVGPRQGALDDAVVAAIALPAPLGVGVAAPSWTLMLRPKAGWSPVGRVAADGVLLTALAWLLALGTYDLVRTTERLRAALKGAREHVHATHQRLMAEIATREGLQKSLEHAHYHDAFTGLPNRRYFMDQLDRGLRIARTRRRFSIGIILVAIDRFRLVTDTLGQNAGDELMIQVARRLEATPAATERVITRWAGDQFAVMLFDVHSIETAMSVAMLMQAAIAEPFELRRFRLKAAACVGVTCVHSGLQGAEGVLREADIALSAARQQGGSRVVQFLPSMHREAARIVHLEADLHVALDRGEFRLVFQPVVDLRTRHYIGVEALLRWHHPVEGVLLPGRFLAIAEEAGLTVAITQWLVVRACSVAREWRRRLPADATFFVSVNLSPAVLRDATFADYVSNVLAQAHVPPECLRLELREDALANGLGGANELLIRLKRKGIGLMLDDFGTGYSSLAYLQHCPFDYVKIDRSLVSNASPAGPHGSIVSALVQMAVSIGLKTVAENVETEAAAHRLQRMGCHFGQGYVFCEPLPAEQVLARFVGQYPPSDPTTGLDPLAGHLSHA